MTHQLIEIVRPGLDDPASFVQKGVVQDPEEMTQDDVGKCVLFGWNGVLIIADMCHHLLMMLVTRRWGHPNPNPDSLRRRVPDLRNSLPCSPSFRRIVIRWGGAEPVAACGGVGRVRGVCHVEFHRLG